jgi:hypothetical protein
LRSSKATAPRSAPERDGQDREEHARDGAELERVQDRRQQLGRHAGDGDAHDQHRPERQQREDVAELARHEARLLARWLLEHRHQRLAHARQPAEARVEREQDADAEDPGRGRLQRAEADAVVATDEPRQHRVRGVDEGVLGAGVDLGDLAEDREGERQDREEGQEREVGDRRREAIAVDGAVVLEHPREVVDERTPRAQAGEAFLGRGDDRHAQPRAYSWVGCQPSSSSWT